MTLSGHSHSFDTGIAKDLGVNCAIVYNHILYWLRFNASRGTGIVDGKVWMYETQQQISDFLEYLSVDEVKKAIPKLVEAGLLIKANHNKNSFDKTNWYTVENQGLIQKNLTKEPYGTIDRVNSTIDSANRHDRESPTARCIYDNKNKEIITNDDDDRVREADEKFLITRDSKGRERSHPIAEIIKYLRTCKYPEETIKEAIKRTQTFPDPISNALKFVESICIQIEAQNAKERPKSKKKEVNRKIEPTYTPHDPNKPMANLWEEMQKTKGK